MTAKLHYWIGLSRIGWVLRANCDMDVVICVGFRAGLNTVNGESPRFSGVIGGVIGDGMHRALIFVETQELPRPVLRPAA